MTHLGFPLSGGTQPAGGSQHPAAPGAGGAAPRTPAVRITPAHMVRTETIRVDGANPRERGMKRASQIAARVRSTVQGYTDYFESLGVSEHQQKQAARDSMQALRDWNPALYEEVSGIALGSGMQVNQLGITLARTEILSLAQQQPAECSTITCSRPGSTVSVQSWDWTVRFVNAWHYHRVEALPAGQSHNPARPGEAVRDLAHAGFAEYGMPGKIGMNESGLGVHLNLLKHRDDAPGGVPIHSVLATILANATTTAEAADIIRSAGTSASSVITVVTAAEAVRTEISPGAVTELRDEGLRVHTNHFLSQTEEQGARMLRPDSDTYDRFAAVQAKVDALAAADTHAAADLLPALCAPMGAAPPNPLDAAATLVTVQFDPAQKTVTLNPGEAQYVRDSRQVFQF